ncbi:MAG: hypothetical protein ABWX95_05620 [Methyloceanibacter sp.]
MPEEDVLSPTHLLAADEKASQRRHSGHGKHQRTLAHEGRKEELYGDGEPDHHEDELRRFLR